MKVIEGQFGQKTVNEDLVRDLRSMADAAERGEITDLIATFIQDGEYHFMRACSPKDYVFLAALQQRKSIDGVIISPTV